jgi:prepilin-type N-terminal cleavage/methylation domain-containing protein
MKQLDSYIKILFRKNKKAFTFVEILVAVLIVALISTLVMISLSNSRSKGRDLKKINDVNQIQIALENYKNVEGEYPEQLNLGDQLIGSSSDLVFLNEIPGDFSYLLFGENYYELEFELENNSDQLSEGLNLATPEGITNKDIIPDLSSNYLKFDGVDDYLSSSQNVDFNINSGDYSASAWIYVDNQDLMNWQTVVGVGQQYLYGFHLYANRVCTYGDSTAFCVSFDSYVPRNQWYLATIVHNFSSKKFFAYLNGVKVNEGTYTINLVNAINRPITSGYRGTYTVGIPNYFKGYIYDARIYRRVLNPEEIVSLYEGGKISSSDLVVRWIMDDGLGCAVLDSSINKNNASLLPDCPTSCPMWVNSVL